MSIETPRRALLGQARHNWMITRCALAWAWAVTPWLVVAAAGPMVALGVACWAVAIQLGRPGWILRPWRAAWWRSRWWFDARSAGLVVVADPTINAVHERGGSHAVGIEIAPRIRRIRFDGTSRTLEVRTVPGQAVEDYDRAQPALGHRWGANVTIAAHPTRRRVMVIKAVDPRVLARTVTHPGA